jgi:hypothetical protein
VMEGLGLVERVGRGRSCDGGVALSVLQFKLLLCGIAWLAAWKMLDFCLLAWHGKAGVIAPALIASLGRYSALQPPSIHAKLAMLPDQRRSEHLTYGTKDSHNNLNQIEITVELEQIPSQEVSLFCALIFGNVRIDKVR